MDRHAFLRCQEWLEPLPHGAAGKVDTLLPESSSHARSSPAPITAFVGAASLHVSAAEQYEPVAQFAGPLAPDALHLSFAASGPASDPMQLRLLVNISTTPPSSGSSRQLNSLGKPQMDVILVLDGTHYRLLLQQATRLVIPQQLAPLLPAVLQQELLSQRPQITSLHVGVQLDQAVAAASATGGKATFLALAAAGPLPFLTLIFPHTCLNIYPLGWKAAAAHISKEHDAAELARLAQLLVECRQQGRERLRQESPQVPAQQAQQGPGDWIAAHQAMLRELQTMSPAAARILASCSGPAQLTAEATQEAWVRLAASAAALCCSCQDAAAALPAEQQAVELQQLRLEQAVDAAMCARAEGKPVHGREVAAQLQQLVQRQGQLTACSALAGHA